MGRGGVWWSREARRPAPAWPPHSPGRLVARGAVRPGRAVSAEEEARVPEMLSSEKRSMLSLRGARALTCSSGGRVAQTTAF